MFNKKAITEYTKILSINAVLLLTTMFVYNQIISLLGNLGIYIQIVFIIIYYILIFIPVYIFCYALSIDKINNILNIFNKLKDKNNNEPIESNIYFFILSLIFYVLIGFFYYIPYIGEYLNIILMSYGYGFYCFEYCCSYKKIQNIKKLAIIESNPYYFIGYGLIYGLLITYINTFNFFIVFSMLFPLSVLNLRKFNLYNLEIESYKSKIFYIPAIVSNIVLSVIDSFLISYYNLNHSE